MNLSSPEKNVTPNGVRFSEKVELTVALCDEIWPQWQIWLMLLWARKFAIMSNIYFAGDGTWIFIHM